MKKKLISLLLASVMTLSLAACGGDVADNTTDTTGSETTKEDAVAKDTYTYNDYVSNLCTNWNPHTYQTEDDGYLSEFLEVGLYGFVFNDELHPVDGLEPFAGYKIIPEMAASMPVDVTEQVKTEHPEFNIPASATEGYAYTIDLNPNAVWEDGTVINADSYVYSMQRLLDPQLLNYRAPDYYTGTFSIAGAEAYANSGRVVKTIISVDGEAMTYELADLTKGEDGVYITPEGYPVYFGLKTGYAWMDGNSLEDYYGAGYIPEEVYSALSQGADADGFVPVTDETIETLYTFTGSDGWGNETKEQLSYYMSYDMTWPEADFANVGLYKSGEYQITLVLSKSLTGFDLLYSLGRNWLVYEDLYESCLKQDGNTWTSTYFTSVDTTKSYGPYKLVSYQSDKALRLEKNEAWYGYTDGQHTYVDPVDGQTYDMYQTTAIETEMVAETATAKLMFLKGELTVYGLGSEDFATYRNSDYAYVTPAEVIYFFLFNGHKGAIATREGNADFDKTQYDLETITLDSFRRAVAVTYDKELFASTISPARSGGYGLLGTAFVYDPDTGARYRDSDQAKQVLCDFYSVDVSQYASLDEAAASITGYDPERAKELYTQAFNEALEAGYITDADGNGISDQTVSIEYCMAVDNDFMTQTVDYLNEKMSEVTVGTPFEGKIIFVKSAPYGNDWNKKIKAGMSDTVLAGWGGVPLNPFDAIRVYTDPSQQMDAAWFDATTVDMTLTINGEEITMNLNQWGEVLNGTTIAIGDKEYNFGSGIADADVRLQILAAIEGRVLQTYDYIPMLQDAGTTLLSQQVFYVVEEYNPVMGRGGITYLKYNYSDAEWADYVAEQGGELKY